MGRTFIFIPCLYSCVYSSPKFPCYFPLKSFLIWNIFFNWTLCYVTFHWLSTITFLLKFNRDQYRICDYFVYTGGFFSRNIQLNWRCHFDRAKTIEVQCIPIESANDSVVYFRCGYQKPLTMIHMVLLYFASFQSHHSPRVVFPLLISTSEYQLDDTIVPVTIFVINLFIFKLKFCST